VEGLGELHLEEGLRMNPDDIAGLGIEPGQAVTVSLGGLDMVLDAQSDPDCLPGALYVSRAEALGALAGRGVLEPLAHLPATPVKVRVAAGYRSRAQAEGGGRVPGR
jgi:hypothetical protein